MIEMLIIASLVVMMTKTKKFKENIIQTFFMECSFQCRRQGKNQ